MTHDRLIATLYGVSVALTALGVAVALAAVRSLRPWRWGE